MKRNHSILCAYALLFAGWNTAADGSGTNYAEVVGVRDLYWDTTRYNHTASTGADNFQLYRCQIVIVDAAPIRSDSGMNTRYRTD